VSTIFSQAVVRKKSILNEIRRNRAEDYSICLSSAKIPNDIDLILHNPQAAIPLYGILAKDRYVL
jgi:hypothetical protein